MTLEYYTSANSTAQLENFSDLVADGILTVEQAAVRAGMTVEEFKAKTGMN